ncbi:MAG TPA: hypothetical protein VGV61_04585 [Thermoanaerobaculia bacterium]|jgi:hypothetical protein|nr:hypothetical protein [Thermoanaerobaculia bacterium]
MKKLGELLVEREWLTPEQLTQALRHQQVFGGRIGSCLLELTLLSEDRLSKALAEQLGVPAASVDDLRVVADNVLELVPAKLACRARAVPFERFGNAISVAMVNTRDLMLQDELSFVTSRRLKVHVAPEVRVLEALEKHYSCTTEPRYSRIWDRLNRARYLWQGEVPSDAPAIGRRRGLEPPPPSPPPPARSSPSSEWQPAPPPPLDSGTRMAAAAPAVQASTSAAAPPPLAPPPLFVAPPPVAPAAVAAPAPSTVPPRPAPARAPAPAVAPAPRPASAAPAPARAAAPVRSPVAPAAAAKAPTASPDAETMPLAPTPAPLAAAKKEREERSQADTTPLAMPPRVETVADFERRIAEVEDRNDVADVALSFFERRFQRRLLFMVRGGEVAAWMGTGDGVDQRLFGEIEIGFDQPSLFLNLREGSPFYRGPLPRLEAHQKLVRSWGGKFPKECLLLPVRINDRLVAAVYCDRAGEDLADIDLDELQRVAVLMGRGFESVLRKRKKGG